MRQGARYLAGALLLVVRVAAAEPALAPDAAPEPSSLRIEDDLPPVGAVVTLAAPSAADTAVAPGRRLDTLVSAYSRLGLDLVRGAVPPEHMGVRAPAEDTLSIRLAGRAEGTARFGTRAKVKVAGRVDAEVGLDGDDHIHTERYEARIWDTYADFYRRFVDLRVGSQVVSWGACDLISPNDVVNPRDLRRGPLAPVDETRLPVLAAQARLYAGPLSLSALWLPVAPVNRFDLIDGDFALLGPNAPTRNERTVGGIVRSLRDQPALRLPLSPILDIGRPPDNGLATGELGARLALETRHVDVGVFALWGHERNPVIRVAPGLIQVLAETAPADLTPQLIGDTISSLASMGVPAIETAYPRRLHVGAGLATRIEPLGIKLEAAYQPEANAILVPPGGGPLLGETRRLPQLAVSGSLDYDRGEALSVIVEAGYLGVSGVPAGRSVFQLARDHLWMVASRIEWRLERIPLALRFLGFVNVSSPSYALGPAVRYIGDDHVQVELGLALYGGPAGSFGGLADRNDELAITVEWNL